MKREAPAWLGELQARFAAAIRTPLERASGTLTAPLSAYDPRLVQALGGAAAKAPQRLAVYNRQYWFRLFDALQTAFPLTARLLGYWSFNDYAGRFLLTHPPRGWNIDEVPSGFDAFFADALQCEDPGRRRALIESARIDAAWRAVFAAEKTPVFRPSDADAARLLDAQLVPSDAVRFVEEHGPLVELRRLLAREPSTGALALPSPLPHSRWWAIAGVGDGVATLPLEAREAELLTLLGRLSIRSALARLEQACTLEERAHLPQRTRAWLARSVAAGFWSAVSFAG
ncbi:MAG TPA: DNA-binding domain-containing protein [Polyangiaceae bacterium]|nr:DNA-binding domain-containing protein [Polyangiaceae bacterium]